MKKRMILIIISVAMISSLVACQQTDVVGNVAKSSFANVLSAVPDRISEDNYYGGWVLGAPDNTAEFIWSKDYSKTELYDLILRADVAPFVTAGLDINKLPAGMVSNGKFTVGNNISDDKINYDQEATPENSFDQLVNKYRSLIGYHEELDHYGVDLGNGNKFEWAKDMSVNDKDIVFVLDPKILIDAGVIPENVNGWVYATVKMKDSKGRTVEVKKFLKPFNLT